MKQLFLALKFLGGMINMIFFKKLKNRKKVTTQEKVNKEEDLKELKEYYENYYKQINGSAPGNSVIKTDQVIDCLQEFLNNENEQPKCIELQKLIQKE